LIPTNELEVIEVNLQSRFISGLGILLYLIKHSRADIANVHRELAKCIDGETLAVFKEILIVIRFVVEPQLFCLNMEAKIDEEDWNLSVYSDNN
jgi:hypothetical protein